jgi:glycosyltransferase involved in cell wall biosynthesis
MLQNWIIRPLDNLSEHEVGEQLRKARIFLSLSHHEGFGLPAAEAMSCGAFVIGYHGFSGREFLLPEFSSPVEPGDVLAFAAALERVLQRDADAPGWCEKKGEQASAFIREEYSPSREERDVLALYSRFLGLIAHRHPRASATGI